MKVHPIQVVGLCLMVCLAVGCAPRLASAVQSTDSARVAATQLVTRACGTAIGIEHGAMHAWAVAMMGPLCTRGWH